MIRMSKGDFVSSQGLAFLAHRLRRLSEQLVEASGDWLREQGLRTPPRAVSTVQLLYRDGSLAITEIASELRFSHPLILKLADQLVSLGLAETAQDTCDRRRRMVTLTASGRAEAGQLLQTNRAIAASYAEVLNVAGFDALGLVEALEQDCRSGAFADRLRRNLVAEEPAA